MMRADHVFDSGWPLILCIFCVLLRPPYQAMLTNAHQLFWETTYEHFILIQLIAHAQKFIFILFFFL